MEIQDELDGPRENPYRSPNALSNAPTIARESFLMLASFVLISALGCTFIFSCWKQVDRSLGMVRCLGFVAIMGGVHFVGFRVWQRQREPAAKSANPQAIAGSVWQRHVPHGLLWVVLATILGLLLKSLML